MEEVIRQELFHNSWWEVHVREALDVIGNINKVQGRVVEFLTAFSRGFTLLELHPLYQVAADVQANLQMFIECLEALLGDTALHPQYR